MIQKGLPLTEEQNKNDVTELSIFGKVDIFTYDDKQFEFKITEGFDGKAVTTFELLKLCQDIAGPVYKYIGKCNTDKNMFHLTLKK